LDLNRNLASASVFILLNWGKHSLLLLLAQRGIKPYIYAQARKSDAWFDRKEIRMLNLFLHIHLGRSGIPLVFKGEMLNLPFQLLSIELNIHISRATIMA
jgi:hypothetical protein